MRSTAGFLPLRFGVVALSLLVAAPAWAQWSRIVELPASDIFSVWANGDTIAAGADTAVYVSTDGGGTWKRSVKVAPGVNTINGVWVRNRRLYAGTFGQGVLVSDDLGTTWLEFNEGLVGGFLDTQRNISNFLVRGDSLYAATEGGAWVRRLAAGTWSHFGSAFEDNEASQMLAIGANDTRLVAAAGFNGQVFLRDRGDADWAALWLNDVGPQAGLAPLSVVWTGQGWVMGTNIGAFISSTGQPPWTHSGPDIRPLLNMSLALRGRDVFAALTPGGGSLIEFSRDDGVTWQQIEALPGALIYRLAVSGSNLYAGRVDGLWRRSIATVSVPDATAPTRLQFAIAGSQPIVDDVRFRFDLPAPGPIVIEVFDVAGRRAADSIRGSWPAGPHEMTWDASGLRSGFYLARLTAGRERAVARMIRIR
jgi:hypothetical protein